MTNPYFCCKFAIQTKIINHITEGSLYKRSKNMKNLEQIKKELIDFTESHIASDRIFNSIKGNNLTELFSNIMPYICWYKENKEKTEEFNSIFDNELVIEDGILLCNCTNLTAISIPNSVTVIGDAAFYSCIKLKSVIIGNSVTSIGSSNTSC